MNNYDAISKPTPAPFMWPAKFEIFGVNVSATTYSEALDDVILAAKSKRPACISHLAVHGLIEGSRDPILREMLNEFDIIAPDGQPVRAAINLLYKKKLPDRCYGPEFMVRVCQRAAAEKIGVYLYGSHLGVVETLRDNLVARYPGLRIVGSGPSMFRMLTEEEDEALVRRINESGAGIVFIGLGCPLQEQFAYAHRKSINAVQICVGAAFDFLSGNKAMAPSWMQKTSLEWFFRLLQEPQRLWKRYLVTNFIFLGKLVLQLCRLR